MPISCHFLCGSTTLVMVGFWNQRKCYYLRCRNTLAKQMDALRIKHPMAFWGTHSMGLISANFLCGSTIRSRTRLGSPVESQWNTLGLHFGLTHTPRGSAPPCACDPRRAGSRPPTHTTRADARPTHRPRPATSWATVEGPGKKRRPLCGSTT